MMAGERRLSPRRLSVNVIIVFVHSWIALHSTVTVVISFEQSGDMSMFRWFYVAASSVSRRGRLAAHTSDATSQKN